MHVSENTLSIIHFSVHPIITIYARNIRQFCLIINWTTYT
jgi:hypothetical protein